MLKKYWWLAVSIILFIPIYLNLGKENVNVDQFLWYKRSQNFAHAIESGNFDQTYQQYHPGVTLMYLILAGQKTFEIIHNDPQINSKINYEYAVSYNFWTKFYLVSFIILIIATSALFLYKITNNKYISILYFSLLLIEPYFIGNVRNLHMDALLSVLIAASVTSYFASIQNKKFSYTIISGLITGLALLTKSVSFSIFILNLLVTAYFWLIKIPDRKNLLKIFGIYLLSVVTTFVILFPAMWVNPIGTLNKIYIEGVLKTGVYGEDNFSHYINGEIVLDPGPTFYLLVTKYRLSIVGQVLLAMNIIIALYLIFKNKLNGLKSFLLRDSSYSQFFSLIFLYILGYFILFTILTKKTDRYLTVLFPLITMLSAYILFYLDFLLKKTNIYYIFIFITTSLILSNVITLFMIHPYYFAYYNPIWGGLEKARYEMYINQGGIGTYEVAKYLNNQQIKTEEMVGATNFNELDYFLKHEAVGLGRTNLKDYKYVVLTMQKDRDYKKGRDTVYIIKILGSDYLRVAEKID